MGSPAILTWRRPSGLKMVFSFGNHEDDEVLFCYFYLPLLIFVWVLAFIHFYLKLRFGEESSFSILLVSSLSM